MKPPTPYLDDYAHTMLLFYLQERNIPISAIDHIEVSLIKNKSTMTKHRKIKIILKQNKMEKENNVIPTPMGMSYDKIQKLNDCRPATFDTTREKWWYEIGLIDGVEAAELKINPEIAILRTIASKTAQMREMQKLYFKTRASGILEKSKQLESEVDTALSQLKDLTQPKQQSLTF